MEKERKVETVSNGNRERSRKDCNPLSKLIDTIERIEMKWDSECSKEEVGKRIEKADWFKRCKIGGWIIRKEDQYQ